MENEIYREYLAWFAGKAKAGETPLAWEEIFHTFLFGQALREDPQKALVWDQAYFITWIRPAQSRSGRAEWFIFSETDTLLLEENGDVFPDPIETVYARVTNIL